LRGAGAFRLMLSSASLLFILKSGCLNSQACVAVSSWLHQRRAPWLVGRRALGITKKGRQAYPGTVWRLAILFVVVSNFVEVVLVQLTNEAGKVAVLEMLG
jgi:hypothetical protein